MFLAFTAPIASGHGGNENKGVPTVRPASAHMAEELTVELVQAKAVYARADRKDRPKRLASLESIARERRDLLVLLMESNPGEVLRLAMPKNMQVAFPASARRYFETEVSEEGVLTVFHVDMAGEKYGGERYEYFLATASGERELHFASNPTRLLTDSKIRVKGIRLGSDIALASGGSGSVVTIRAALPNTLGIQKTLLILVNFSDAPTLQPFTPAQGAAVVFGEMNNYDFEVSYQQTTSVGDVTPWYTLPMTSAGCDPTTLANQAQAAATAGGFVLSNYKRYIFAFPSNGCGWLGLGTIGGNPSKSWIFANRGFGLPVVMHEMGHNLGLYHSHSLDCGAAVVGSAGCTTAEYGDALDVMGGTPSVGSASNRPSAHFNAFQKERLGWLNAGISPPLTTVQNNSGQFSIANLEAPRNNTPRALKIANQLPTCNLPPTEWYYVEKREAVGFDSFLAELPNSVSSGVIVHRVTEGDADSSYLLDMTPATSNWPDVQLNAGSTFTDPATGLSIQPASVGTGFANVNITYAAPSCATPPRVTLSPADTQWRSPGQAIDYTVTVTNADGCQCAATAYDVRAAVPAGWNSSVGQTAAIAPGGSAQVNVGITSYGSAAPGFYDIPVVASAPAVASKTASANASIALNIPVELVNGVAVGPLGIPTGQGLIYTFNVPAGKTSLSFTTTGGTGDVDMYVKRGSIPSVGTGDCKSEGPVTSEQCSFNSPQGGTYYVLLYSFATFSGVSLTAQYSPSDPVVPAISIGDVVVSEGDAGTKLTNFTVSLSAVSASPVTFDISTDAGTAAPGVDFVSKALAGQSIPAGQSSYNFSVAIIGDLAIENNETFTVNLGNVVGSNVGDSQAQGRINNDDLATLSISDATELEGSPGASGAWTTMNFVVSLSAPVPNPVRFSIATVGGGAVAGDDFQGKTVPAGYMDAGRTTQVFAVMVSADSVAEQNETFTVQLSNVQDALLGDGVGLGTISNDDGAAVTTSAVQKSQKPQLRPATRKTLN